MFMESTEVVKITSNQSSSCDSVSREKRNHILSYTFQNILKMQTLVINSYPKKKMKILELGQIYRILGFSFVSFSLKMTQYPFNV